MSTAEFTLDQPAPSTVEPTPLSPSDFRTYNRMAEEMDLYHNHFRQTWREIYEACENGSNATAASSSQGQGRKLSAPALISKTLSFLSRLSAHHDIEETYIFPHLARKMPHFDDDAVDGPKEDHRKIHQGMEQLEDYLVQCRSGERVLRREEVKAIMDGFGQVLWSHLEEEVRLLGAENMRGFWTLEEMRRMPM